MSRFVIVVFADETKAQAGIAALGDLQREANATIYGTAAVRLDVSTGGLVVVQPTDRGALQLGVGALVKGLGEFFGTSASALLGEDSRAPTGESWRDYLRTDVMSDDSLEDVAVLMQHGDVAVLTEVSDDCVALIDARMSALGGRLVPVRRENFAADVLAKGAVALTADIHEWKADHAAIQSRAMERTLSDRIDEARAELRRTADIARLRQDRVQEELDAQLSALAVEAALATPDTRLGIEHRLGELRHDLGERAKKLARAYQLTQEALRA